MADDITALIAPALRGWPMNEEQRAIVSYKHGPLLVIAGPGSGKTRSLTLLAMNLLLCGDAKPSEIVLCTYTEKAAFELQDRLANTARLVDYNIDSNIQQFCISSFSVVHEAEQFAELVCWLKQQGTIGDYSEVALLLHSVKPWMSKPYIDALKEKEIPAYCPRARTFFIELEICLLVGALARILGYEPGIRGATTDETDYLSYICHCCNRLAEHCRKFSALEQQLHTMVEEIQALTAHPEQDDKQRLGDYFYRLLCLEPFASFLVNKDRRHNLVLFSRLLQTFQRYYRYEYISDENLQQLREDLLPAFLSFLYTEGIPQDENRQEPPPKGQVQILTIHEAKGLEFPVVVVGRLDKLPPDSKNDDRALKTFYEHPSFEPEERIADFDRRRLYYVALSRAKQLLVCSSSKKPQPYFNTLWKHTTCWPFTYPRLIHIPAYIQTGEHQAPKPRYGFTSHLQTYNACPRRYQYFYEYQFEPSRTAETFFGLLIHQTIERIHRSARDGNFDIFEESQIREAFDIVFHFLLCSHPQPCDEERKEQAFLMVCNYVFSNRQEMRRIVETELSFRVEQEQYVLVGQIDLLLQGRSGLEIVDFKALPRPIYDSPRLNHYKQQLYLYAYALERRTGTFPDHLFLYWMGEERKEQALMEIPCHEGDIYDTLSSINAVVEKIQQQQFAVLTPPDAEICNMCDIRHLCKQEKIIGR